MNTRYDLSSLGEKVVYVKSIDVADLPHELRAQAGDRDHIYAVHNEHGTQLALVADRAMAYVLARQHDMTPVTVH